MGGEDVPLKGPVVSDPTDTQALEKAHNRRSRFHFGMLGIEPAEGLQFKKDKTIECEAVSENQVRFREEVMSLSKSANIVIEVIGYDWGGTIAGPMFWCWHGEKVHDLRLQKE